MSGKSAVGSSIIDVDMTDNCDFHGKHVEISPSISGIASNPTEATMPSGMPDLPQPQSIVEGQVTSSRPRRSSRASSRPVAALEDGSGSSEARPRAERQGKRVKHIYIVDGGKRYKPIYVFGKKKRYFGTYKTMEEAQLALATAMQIMKNSDGKSEQEIQRLVVEAKEAARADVDKLNALKDSSSNEDRPTEVAVKARKDSSSKEDRPREVAVKALKDSSSKEDRPSKARPLVDRQGKRVKHIYRADGGKRFRPAHVFGKKERYFGKYNTLDEAQLALETAMAIMKNSDGKPEKEIQKLVVEAKEAARAAVDKSNAPKDSSSKEDRPREVAVKAPIDSSSKEDRPRDVAVKAPKDLSSKEDRPTEVAVKAPKDSSSKEDRPRQVAVRAKGKPAGLKPILWVDQNQKYRTQHKFGNKARYFGLYRTREEAQIGYDTAMLFMKNSDGKSEEEIKSLVWEAKAAGLAAAEEYRQANPEKFKTSKEKITKKRNRRDSDSNAHGAGTKRARLFAADLPESKDGGRRLRRSTKEARKASELLREHHGATSRSSKNSVSLADGTHSNVGEQLRPAKPRTLDISHFAAGLPTPENCDSYNEEIAWRLYNPTLTLEHTDHQRALPPLPPPPDLPEFPSTGHCEWTWHDDSRVLHGNFRNKHSGAVFVSKDDEAFLLSMMERDDISVISEGLADDLNPDLWSAQHLGNIAGRQYYHKFRKFERKEDCSSVEYEEVDKCVSMKIEDYVRYLDARQDALGKHDILTYKRDERTSADTDFAFFDGEKRENRIDVIDTVLYMIDFDIIKLLPTAYENFASKFKLPGILPGGKDCMMNAVNENGRPFMGPNLYVTPPASFTHFHQDGHGTVDSGHQCLSGYNEVVMLRRLPEKHKKYALYLLSGSGMNGTGQYDALYGLPHGDGVGAKPTWPECDSIERCREMGYCPSVFILKPGQLVHINKGRLHAFRKMAPSPLPEKDCHAKLRGAILYDLGGAYKEEICVSVAWDWMYRGVSSEGINREIVSMLECAALNRNNLSKETLAIPEHSILQMAQRWSTALEVAESSWMQFSKSTSRSDTHAFPSPGTILKGILPSLRYVVGKHVEAESTAMAQANPRSRSDRVSIAKKPNSWENPDAFALDPYGNSDFFCRLCQKELSNVYMHCDGCEKILHKDYNICVDCHTEERYKRFDQMHPLNDRKHSTTNHTGHFNKDRQSRCPCKKGPCCISCGYCAGCSCRCHKWFTLNYRFTTIEEEKALLDRVEAKVGEFPAEETMARLGWIGSWNGRGTVESPGLRDENINSSASRKKAEAANETFASNSFDKVSAATNENETAALEQSGQSHGTNAREGATVLQEEAGFDSVRSSTLQEESSVSTRDLLPPLAHRKEECIMVVPPGALPAYDTDANASVQEEKQPCGSDHTSVYADGPKEEAAM